MNKQHIMLAVLLGLMPFHGYSQKRVSLINNDWEFVRLNDKTAGRIEAGQQGSDWNSQFNVAHRGATGITTLALPDSLVQAERRQITAHGSGWEQVSLPHTAAIEPYVIKQPWQGVCYYRRHLQVEHLNAGEQLWLEFEGAMSLCDVWVNGRHIGQHAGGFNSFVIDATGSLRDGDNEIIVRLDNRDNGVIPPGKPLGDLDFCYHSGLYRDVRLIRKNALHITHPLLADCVAGGGIFVTYPEVSEASVTVKVKAQIANADTTSRLFTLRHRLYELTSKGKRGRMVGETSQSASLAAGSNTETTQTIAVKQPYLWSPDAPNRYVLVSEVIADGKAIDSEETKIGIRQIEMTDKGCFINGKRYDLVGTNRHQEYPFVGNAVSNAAHRRDVWQMRNEGFNVVRLGHYPQDPDLLDACDEWGLLAIEPIPGWQYFSSDSIFVANTYSDIRSLIRRDRNHPSVIMWETTLNESWPPSWWKDGAVKTAHEEMPDGQCFTSGDCYGYSGFDVCYNDWDQAGFSRPNKSGKPGFIREFYDYEFGGHYSTSRITRGDGERAQRQNLWNAWWSLNSNNTRSNNTMGGAVWSMYDYNRGCCDNICYSGVADLFRRPKYSLPFFRSQLSRGDFTPAGAVPYELFVASRWDAESADTVIVLGNVSEVALRVNGREVARKKVEQLPFTAYEKDCNGQNSNTLAHPPVMFTGIAFETGVLEAVGYDEGGREVTRSRVVTPSSPMRLVLDYFESGVPAEREDLLIVYAHLVDERGHATHVNGERVRLEVVDGGVVEGPAVQESEDGTASFIVRTADASRLQLKATWGEKTAGLKLSLRARR